MEQVETFSQCVDEFLVLGGILTQIDLCLAVTWIVVILTFAEEVVARLIVVLIEDGKVDFLCQFPSCLEVMVYPRTEDRGMKNGWTLGGQGMI